jgi:hypothetical protein
MDAVLQSLEDLFSYILERLQGAVGKFARLAVISVGSHPNIAATLFAMSVLSMLLQNF